MSTARGAITVPEHDPAVPIASLIVRLTMGVFPAEQVDPLVIAVSPLDVAAIAPQASTFCAGGFGVGLVGVELPPPPPPQPIRAASAAARVYLGDTTSSIRQSRAVESDAVCRAVVGRQVAMLSPGCDTMSRWNAGMLRLLLLATLFAQPAAGAATTYLFSYFTGNGEDGLHFRDEP